MSVYCILVRMQRRTVVVVVSRRMRGEEWKLWVSAVVGKGLSSSRYGGASTA